MVTNRFLAGLVKFIAHSYTLAIFSLFFALSSILSAEVSVIPSAPTYNYQVLPGSTRQIEVNITGGTQNTVNWSVLSATGGATATFTTPSENEASSITAGLATVQVNIGATAGNCTIPQAQSAIGTYTVTSTATVIVSAQSVDNPTKFATFLFNVCARTTTVLIVPAYQQAFKGQHRMLQSWVTGDTDETGTWSIVAQPGGGDATLADTTNRDTDFVATVTGRYTLEYISNSDPSQSATAIVYVSPNAMPSYVSTPDQTEPHECYVDPALTGGDYEVGAGKQYATIQSTPAANTLAPGSIIRIWNTDTTGASPSTYHEYYQLASSGTPTEPIILCGVPDALGNLPIIDGSNATTQPGTDIDTHDGVGVLNIWAGGYGASDPYGFWQSGSAGPSYVSVTGLHIAHATPVFSYTPPGGGEPTPYATFTGCVNVRSGNYIDVSGNDLDTCTNGFFSTEYASEGWAAISQFVTVTGNHIHNSGWPGSGSEHQVYFQSFYGVMQGNLIDHYTSGADGSAIKWRGLEGIFRYNNIAAGPLRDFDMVDVEDAIPYVSFEGYLSSSGDTDCSDSLYCLGDTAGPNIIAANQESLQKDFVYGNEIFGSSSLNQIHYAEDGAGGMEDRNGTLYFYSNTLDGAQDVFDNGSSEGYYGFLTQRIDARNNILWAQGAQIEFARYATIILDATTNLMKSGTFSIETPIEGGGSVDTSDGWSDVCVDNACPWPLTVPINTHLYGLSDANYLTTSTIPYNQTTFIPPNGSAALSAGTALSGVPATLPIRWQYAVASNSLVVRAFPLTIGAADQTVSMQNFTIALNPSSLTVIAGQSGTTSVSVTPMYGFSSIVSFSCSGLPTGVSCNFAPLTVTPSGTAASTTLSIAASNSAAVHPRNSLPFLPGSYLAVALCCLCFSKRRRPQMFLLLAVSVLGLTLFTGCGSTSSSGGPQPITTTIRVTASSGSLSQFTNLSLTVN
jgi:hypothetical protein